MNRTQRRAGVRAQRAREQRLEAAERREMDRDLPATLHGLGLRPVNRGPFDSDAPRDPHRTPVIRRRG